MTSLGDLHWNRPPGRSIRSIMRDDYWQYAWVQHGRWRLYLSRCINKKTGALVGDYHVDMYQFRFPKTWVEIDSRWGVEPLIAECLLQEFLARKEPWYRTFWGWLSDYPCHYSEDG